MRKIERCAICSQRYFIRPRNRRNPSLYCSLACSGRAKTLKAEAAPRPTFDTLRRMLLDNCIPEPNSGCWLWEGKTHTDGYGIINLGGRRYYAHRVALGLRGVVLADGDCACHRCDVPACVNPEHIFAGTRGQNIEDMWNKGRAKVTPVASERCSLSRLTWAAVRSIRASDEAAAILAARHGVTEKYIRMIQRFETWNPDAVGNRRATR